MLTGARPVTLAPMEANQAERQRWNNERWAEMWPRRERLTDQITPFLLDALALHLGERVLDVGSGGGKAPLTASAVVGEQGAVVGAAIPAPVTWPAASPAPAPPPPTPTLAPV